MIIDRLYEEIKKKGNVCLGLDTSLDYIPKTWLDQAASIEEAIFYFNKRIIDASRDLVPAYKLQIAYYEAQGLEGLKAYSRTLKYLKELGLISIGDIKRGDIAATADQYAQAHFQGDFEADFITLSPYMGFDSISPYLKYVDSGEKGIFVLMRTSNPGAKDIEYLEAEGRPVYYHVGDHLRELGQTRLGQCGYSGVGAVVGGTHQDQVEEIRDRYRSSFFLIPGYGAQGAGGEDVKKYLIDGNGALVNSSRGIIKNYMKYEDGLENFDKYTRQAVLDMREDLGYEE